MPITSTDTLNHRGNCPTTTKPSNCPFPFRPSRYLASPNFLCPTSSHTAQDKLERHDYATLSAVESDAKRMVANAKQYNDDKSIVYLLSNFMTKNNPAYKNPDYIALPTPIPGENDTANNSSVPSTREHSEQPRKITLSLKARKSSAAVASPAAVNDSSDPTDFTGKTFQQAQEQIINGLIQYTDEE